MSISNENNAIAPGASMVFRLPATFADVRLLGLSVHALFDNMGFDEVESYQLELAVTESANNIVKHAYGFAKNVYFNMKIAVSEDRMTCIFMDTGKFENFLKNNKQGDIATDTNALPPDSRGIYIVCNIMDEVSYRRAGDKNVLTLVKYLP